MNRWRKSFIAVAVILISALLITALPLSSLAAPQGLFGTTVFLPLVLKDFPQTPTPTHTATATATSTPTATPTPTPTSTSTPNSSTVTVTVGSNFYSPITTTIDVGDTIHWVWAGTNHTVTSGNVPTADNQFCSPNDLNCAAPNPSASGSTYDHQFLVAGTYQYFCQVHLSAMKGTIVVLP